MESDAGGGLKVEKLNETSFYACKHKIQLLLALKDLGEHIEEDPLSVMQTILRLGADATKRQWPVLDSPCQTHFLRMCERRPRPKRCRPLSSTS
jgi:hypothetical protein